MIIYAYLDRDYNLNFRTGDYIDNQDLLFWQNNDHMIEQVWKLNTEADEDMYRFFTNLRKFNLTNQVVVDFCRNINFDMEALKKRYAANLQPRP